MLQVFLDVYIIDQCIVTGWGKKDFTDSSVSNILKKIQEFYRLKLSVLECLIKFFRFLWSATLLVSNSFRTPDWEIGSDWIQLFSVREEQ